MDETISKMLVNNLTECPEFIWKQQVDWTEPKSGSFFEFDLQIVWLMSRQGVSMSFTKDIPEFVILSRDAAYVDQSSLRVHQSCSHNKQFEDLHISQFRDLCECHCIYQGNLGNGRVSRTGVADSSDAKDSVSFEGGNVMLPNTQSINGL